MNTPLEIKRITGIDHETTEKLRVFAVSWSNATRLLLKLIGYTDHPESMSKPLTTALVRYMNARAEGLTGIERLGQLLSEMHQEACRLTPDITPELFAQWCSELRIPREAFKQEIDNGRDY